MRRLAKMRLPISYSAPYSYSTAPVELLFAGLKLGDINPLRDPVGKKSLRYVADMVCRQLSKIPRSTLVRYWHHVIKHFYGYLDFKRI